MLQRDETATRLVCGRNSRGAGFDHLSSPRGIESLSKHHTASSLRLLLDASRQHSTSANERLTAVVDLNRELFAP